MLGVVHRSLNNSSPRPERSKIGQFFTPPAIARFMASLFEQHKSDVRIMDPGAGAGVLFAACVETLLAASERPRSITVVAYENDHRVLAHLKDTVDRCASMCKEAGVSFQASIRPEDFVPAAIAQIEEGFFDAEGERYTHTILNPPYMKINSQSATRRLLDRAGIEVSNLYAAFVWLAARMLEPEGELVAITPRSFCNGPYFKRFRLHLMEMMSLQHIHVFESRKKVFGDDEVLQENVIYHAVREGTKREYVSVSTSEGMVFEESTSQMVPYEHVVIPGDRDAFIHLVLDYADNRVIARMAAFTKSLDRLGLNVSTGPVVDFRARKYLRPLPQNGTAPLIYPLHFSHGFIDWPDESCKKANAITVSAKSRHLLLQTGYYVLTKRFTAKEEARRVVAAMYDPERIPTALLGFENHLNYFHAAGHGMELDLAKGLTVYLNSSLFDQYFRLFSGHTQVNATDLRKMRYPVREQLLTLGAYVADRLPDQETLDAILKKECESDG